jgi:hypothetical protein
MIKTPSFVFLCAHFEISITKQQFKIEQMLCEYSIYWKLPPEYLPDVRQAGCETHVCAYKLEYSIIKK